MGVAGGDAAGNPVVWSLRIETARLRHLVEECREEGVSQDGVSHELRAVRSLVEDRQYEDALAHLRELKLEILARLMLQEPVALPPAGIENVPGGLPSGAVLSAINRRPDVDSIRPPRPRTPP